MPCRYYITIPFTEVGNVECTFCRLAMCRLYVCKRSCSSRPKPLNNQVNYPLLHYTSCNVSRSNAKNKFKLPFSAERASPFDPLINPIYSPLALNYKLSTARRNVIIIIIQNINFLSAMLWNAQINILLSISSINVFVYSNFHSAIVQGRRKWWRLFYWLRSSLYFIEINFEFHKKKQGINLFSWMWSKKIHLMACKLYKSKNSIFNFSEITCSLHKNESSR